jgi:hypothetical protein
MNITPNVTEIQYASFGTMENESEREQRERGESNST